MQGGEMLEGDARFDRLCEVRRRRLRWLAPVGALTALMAAGAWVAANINPNPARGEREMFFSFAVGTLLASLALAGVASGYQWAWRVTEEARATEAAILGNPELLPAKAVQRMRRRKMGRRFLIYGAVWIASIGIFALVECNKGLFFSDNRWLESLLPIAWAASIPVGFIAFIETVVAAIGWLRPWSRQMSGKAEVALKEELERIFFPGAFREFLIFRFLIWVGIPCFLVAASAGLI